MPRNRRDLTLKGAIEMPLTFRERQSVIKELANQYKGAAKGDKGLLIDHLQTLTGFNRSYAARVLRTVKNTPVKGQKACSVFA